MNRETLLVALHAGRERLRAALAALPDAAMLDEVDPGWTRKDVVAHLEAWERRVVDLFERLRNGARKSARMSWDEGWRREAQPVLLPEGR